MKKMGSFAFFASAAVMVLGMAVHAENWKESHPRRAEVNGRDRHLDDQTQNAEQNGKINQQQAQKLQGEENAVKQDEQADAAKHDGHITKAEQRQLNRKENRIHRQLRQDEKKDAKSGGSSSTAGAPVQTTAPSAQ